VQQEKDIMSLEAVYQMVKILTYLRLLI